MNIDRKKKELTNKKELQEYIEELEDFVESFQEEKVSAELFVTVNKQVANMKEFLNANNIFKGMSEKDDKTFDRGMKIFDIYDEIIEKQSKLKKNLRKEDIKEAEDEHVGIEQMAE